MLEMIIALQDSYFYNTYFVVLHFVRGLLANECNVFLLTPAIGLIATEKKYEGAENRVNT